MATFDPRLALTFVIIAEELSFTRAAERLGVAQPWVSEQLRRLEDQLGFQLLARNSRRAQLTREGAQFLPYAQALSSANEAAQSYAQSTRIIQTHSLRLGAADVTAEYQERAELIDTFVSERPLVDMVVSSGQADDLVQALVNGDLDVVIAFTESPGADQLMTVPIYQRYGHLVMPMEHPLAQKTSIDLEDMSGEVVVTSNGRSDPHTRNLVLQPLADIGAVFTPAPEASRARVLRYARIKRQLCVNWCRQKAPRQLVGDMVMTPFSGHPLVLTVAILHGRRNQSPAVERLCDIGRRLRARQQAEERAQ